MKQIKFNSGYEMFKYVREGNDLYNFKTHELVRVYNEDNAFIVYNMDENEVRALAMNNWEIDCNIDGDILDHVWLEDRTGDAGMFYLYPTLKYCEENYMEEWVAADKTFLGDIPYSETVKAILRSYGWDICKVVEAGNHLEIDCSIPIDHLTVSGRQVVTFEFNDEKVVDNKHHEIFNADVEAIHRYYQETPPQHSLTELIQAMSKIETKVNEVLYKLERGF